MNAQLTILGSSSATPTKSRFHSAQFLLFGQDHVLIDCGEGTQNRLLIYGLNFQKIDFIFISHMHGDHFLGLPGLINSMALNQRSRKLKVYGPKGLNDVLNLHFSLGGGKVPFDLEIHEIQDGDKIELNDMRCEVVSVFHRIPCFAFIFRQIQTKRKLNVEACNAHNIPTDAFNSITLGEDYTAGNGTIIKNDILTFDPGEAFSYGYITDTLFKAELCQRFQGLRVLYHEATYLHNLIDRAEMTYHSTAQQAASFAIQSAANQLIIGHFSSRYDTLEDHLAEAKQLFPNTILAIEGETNLLN